MIAEFVEALYLALGRPLNEDEGSSFEELIAAVASMREALDSTKGELQAVENAALMPHDYPLGLPRWVTVHLWASLDEAMTKLELLGWRPATEGPADQWPRPCLREWNDQLVLDERRYRDGQWWGPGQFADEPDRHVRYWLEVYPLPDGTTPPNWKSADTARPLAEGHEAEAAPWQSFDTPPPENEAIWVRVPARRFGDELSHAIHGGLIGYTVVPSFAWQSMTAEEREQHKFMYSS